MSSARVAKEFCFAARDVLLLYKAIVPVQLEKHLDSISQVAAIVHNDFYHLSQEILGLAFQVCISNLAVCCYASSWDVVDLCLCLELERRGRGDSPVAPEQ
jgi:hypothetical protein